MKPIERAPITEGEGGGGVESKVGAARKEVSDVTGAIATTIEQRAGETPARTLVYRGQAMNNRGATILPNMCVFAWKDTSTADWRISLRRRVKAWCEADAAKRIDGVASIQAAVLIDSAAILLDAASGAKRGTIKFWFPETETHMLIARDDKGAETYHAIAELTQAGLLEGLGTEALVVEGYT